MRRARNSSPLGLSPQAKRRRGDAGEAQKSNLGGSNRARFDAGDAGIANLDKDKIITEMGSLTIDDSNINFNEAFEASYPSYEGYWRLTSDYFPLEMSCDSESQERLEERGENQSDSAENSLTDLHTAHTDDSLIDQDSEMKFEGEPEANHARPSSEVWKSLPGQKRMRINHGALQRFINTASSDLSMSAERLRETFKKDFEKEACPTPSIFDRNLQKLRAARVEKHPNQQTLLRKKYMNVDHDALRKFIKKTSSDLSMSARALREAYIEKYGKKLCPSLNVFSIALKNMR